MDNRQGQWWLWGLAALCSGVVVWRLWPQVSSAAEALQPAPTLKVPQPSQNPGSVQAEQPSPPALEPEPIRTSVPAPEKSAQHIEVTDQKPRGSEGTATPPVPSKSGAGPTSPGSVHLNTATLSDLKTLPGIGPALAKRIMAARPFEAVDDLLQVSGIGPVVVAALKDEHRVEV